MLIVDIRSEQKRVNYQAAKMKVLYMGIQYTYKTICMYETLHLCIAHTVHSLYIRGEFGKKTLTLISFPAEAFSFNITF